jgi:hypothetical protein
MKFLFRNAKIAAAALVILGLSGLQANAINIAVFGNNSFQTYINSQSGYSVTVVSDANLSTPGFLNAYDAFVYTRNGSEFGGGLSAAAAANVSAWVTGNAVLFNADWFDDLGNANTQLLVKNAVDYVAAGGHGYIGEFNGAVAALTSNSNGFTPLNLMPGHAGELNYLNGGSGGSVSLTASGIGHSVTSGVSFPVNPGGVEYGAALSGYNALNVLATFDGGNPAILARTAAVPEPGSVAMLVGLSISGAGLVARRRRR